MALARRVCSLTCRLRTIQEAREPSQTTLITKKPEPYMSLSRFNLGKLALAAAFVLSTATAAQAADFTFSYQFDASSFITGTLSGDLDGLFVTNISNVHVSMNGTEFTGGSLFAAAWNTTTSSWDNTIGAKVSTDASLNNFIFADANVPTDFGVSNYFFMLNDSNPTFGHEAFATNLNTGDAADNTPITGSWSLQQVAAVPEPDSYAMLLAGAGFVALATRRRRKA
jgi:hypothetical protein